MAIVGGIALFGVGVIALIIAIALFGRYGKFIDKKARHAHSD